MDSSGQPAGNTGDGIVVTSPNNLVGGTDPQERNVIGANGGSGIVVITPQAGHNEFHGNLIGLWRNRVPGEILKLGNGEHGIRFRFNASDNRLGGAAPGSENVFGFNRLNAVSFESGQRNTSFINRFFAQPVPTTAENLIAVAPSANGNILPLTFDYAHSDDLNLRFGVRYTGDPNTTFESEFYIGESVAGTPFDLRLFTLIHRSNLTTDGSGQASREELVTEVSEPFARGFAILRDPAGNSSAASDLVKVIPAGSADLKTQLFAPAQATVGSNFVLTIVVTNCGPATATNVSVEQTVTGLEVISFSPSGTYDGAHYVNFAVGDIPTGQAATLTVTARPRSSGTHLLGAHSFHRADPDYGNDSESAIIQATPPPEVPQADIAITDGEVLDNTGRAGERVTLNFKVSNLGRSDASGVHAAIDLPRGAVVEFVTASSTMQCQQTGGSVSCTMATLLAGGTVEITVLARIPAKSLGQGDPNFSPGSQFVGIKADSNTADANLKNYTGAVEVSIETKLVLDGTSESISWPAALTDMELQSTPNLTPPVVWSPVPTNTIVTADGADTYTVNPRGEGAPPAQFFQLAEKGPPEPQDEFNQISLELDGVQLSFTDWCQLLIGSATHVLASGEQEFRVTYTTAQPLVGGLALRSAQARPDFPNREQGRKECAPASIVNSLEYLNAASTSGFPQRTSASRRSRRPSVGPPTLARPSATICRTPNGCRPRRSTCATATSTSSPR